MFTCNTGEVVFGPVRVSRAQIKSGAAFTFTNVASDTCLVLTTGEHPVAADVSVDGAVVVPHRRFSPRINTIERAFMLAPDSHTLLLAAHRDGDDDKTEGGNGGDVQDDRYDGEPRVWNSDDDTIHRDSSEDHVLGADALHEADDNRADPLADAAFVEVTIRSGASIERHGLVRSEHLSLFNLFAVPQALSPGEASVAFSADGLVRQFSAPPPPSGTWELRWHVDIKDESGCALVRRLVLTQPIGTPSSFSLATAWDLENQAGERMSDGRYAYRIGVSLVRLDHRGDHDEAHSDGSDAHHESGDEHEHHVVDVLHTGIQIVSLDTTPPVATAVHPKNGSAVNDSNPPLLVTWEDPLVGGYASGLDLATAVVLLDGLDITGFVVIDELGVAGFLDGLSQGTHRLQVMIADRMGNVGAALSDFIIDTASPIVEWHEPPASTDAAVVHMAFTLTDTGSGLALDTLAVRANGTEVTAAVQCTPAADGMSAECEGFYPLNEGRWTLWATVRDAAGNQGGASTELTVDRTPPAIILDPDPSRLVTRDSATPIVGRIVDSLPSTLTVSGADVPVVFGSFRTTVDLATGFNDIELVATDSLGHVGRRVVTVTRDPAYPEMSALAIGDQTVPCVDPSAGSASAVVATTVSPYLAASYVDQGSAGIQASSLQLTVDELPRVCTVSTASGASCLLDLDAGPHRIVFSVADFAGNRRACAIAVTIDAVTVSGTPGTALANAQVQVPRHYVGTSGVQMQLVATTPIGTAFGDQFKTVGPVVDILPSVALAPDGDETIRITLPFDPAALVSPSGDRLSKENVRVHWFDPVTGIWQAAQTTQWIINVAANTVTFDTHHLTAWAATISWRRPIAAIAAAAMIDNGMAEAADDAVKVIDLASFATYHLAGGVPGEQLSATLSADDKFELSANRWVDCVDFDHPKASLGNLKAVKRAGPNLIAALYRNYFVFPTKVGPYHPVDEFGEVHVDMDEIILIRTTGGIVGRLRAWNRAAFVDVYDPPLRIAKMTIRDFAFNSTGTSVYALGDTNADTAIGPYASTSDGDGLYSATWASQGGVVRMWPNVHARFEVGPSAAIALSELWGGTSIFVLGGGPRGWMTAHSGDDYTTHWSQCDTYVPTSVGALNLAGTQGAEVAASLRTILGSEAFSIRSGPYGGGFDTLSLSELVTAYRACGVDVSAEGILAQPVGPAADWSSYPSCEAVAFEKRQCCYLVAALHARNPANRDLVSNMLEAGQILVLQADFNLRRVGTISTSHGYSDDLRDETVTCDGARWTAGTETATLSDPNAGLLVDSAGVLWARQTHLELSTTQSRITVPLAYTGFITAHPAVTVFPLFTGATIDADVAAQVGANRDFSTLPPSTQDSWALGRSAIAPAWGGSNIVAVAPDSTVYWLLETAQGGMSSDRIGGAFPASYAETFKSAPLTTSVSTVTEQLGGKMVRSVVMAGVGKVEVPDPDPTHNPPETYSFVSKISVPPSYVAITQSSYTFRDATGTIISKTFAMDASGQQLGGVQHDLVSLGQFDGLGFIPRDPLVVVGQQASLAESAPFPAPTLSFVDRPNLGGPATVAEFKDTTTLYPFKISLQRFVLEGTGNPTAPPYSGHSIDTTLAELQTFVDNSGPTPPGRRSTILVRVFVGPLDERSVVIPNTRIRTAASGDAAGRVFVTPQPPLVTDANGIIGPDSHYMFFVAIDPLTGIADVFADCDDGSLPKFGPSDSGLFPRPSDGTVGGAPDNGSGELTPYGGSLGAAPATLVPCADGDSSSLCLRGFAMQELEGRRQFVFADVLVCGAAAPVYAAEPYQIPRTGQQSFVSEPLVVLHGVEPKWCSTDSGCDSGYCVDSYCCDKPCGGGVAHDCQACSVMAGADVNGVCMVLPHFGRDGWPVQCGQFEPDKYTAEQMCKILGHPTPDCAALSKDAICATYGAGTGCDPACGSVATCDGVHTTCSVEGDADGDGHFSISAPGCVWPKDDCDDNDPTIHPYAPEICDFKDNDCDGEVDEDCTVAVCTGEACPPYDPSAEFTTAFADFKANTLLPSPTRMPAAAVGAMAGELHITLDGAAEYEVPIAVPPGRRGMQPALSLKYSSRQGNGALGVGWVITGVSEIRRCRPTPLRDGAYDSLHFSAADPLCLDGERLVQMPSSACAAGEVEFRPLRNPYSKVCAAVDLTGNPRSFVVWRKDGNVATYLSDHAAIVGTDDNGPILAWPITRLSDRWGNYIAYQYTYASSFSLFAPPPPPADVSQPGSTGQQQDPMLVAAPGATYNITKISYTGNEAAGLPATKAVEFTYEKRTDPLVGYYAAKRIGVYHRLASITTRSMIAPGETNGTQVLTYAVRYTAWGSSTLSAIDGISECPASADPATLVGCKPATTFTWAPSPSGWVETASVGGLAGVSRFGDQVWFTPDGGFPMCAAGPAQFFPFWGDFDANGREELNLVRRVRVYNSPGDPMNTSVGRYADGFAFDLLSSGAFSASTRTIGSLADPYSGSGPNDNVHVVELDYDGDGRTDFTWGYSLFLASNGFVPQRAPWELTGYQSWTGDFDGDGGDDILTSDGANLRLYSRKSDPPWSAQLIDAPDLSSLFEAPTAVLDVDDDGRDELVSATMTFGDDGEKAQPLPFGEYVVLDANGDGLRDLLVMSTNSHCTSSCTESLDVDLLLGTGGGFVNFGHLVLSSTNDPAVAAMGRAAARLVRVADVNGDGADEALMPLNGELLQLSFAGSEIHSSATGITFAGTVDNGLVLWVHDVTGDGLQDVILNDGTGWHVFKASGGGAAVVTGVTDGVGGAATVAYSYTSESVYSGPGAPDVSGEPVQLTASPIQVVSRATSVGAQSFDNEYAYDNMRLHRRGAGWLGFDHVKVTDLLMPGKTTDYYFDNSFNAAVQDFPFAGLPTLVEMRIANAAGSELVSRDTRLPVVRQSVGVATYAVEVRSSGHITERDHVAATVEQATESFDEFGNPLQLEVKTRMGPAASSGIDAFLATVADAAKRGAWGAKLVRRLAAETADSVTRHTWTYSNDAATWLVSRVKTHDVETMSSLCSAAEQPGVTGWQPSWFTTCPQGGKTTRHVLYVPQTIAVTSSLVASEVDRIYLDPASDAAPEASYREMVDFDYASDGTGNVVTMSATGEMDAQHRRATRKVELAYEPAEKSLVYERVAGGLTTEYVMDRDFGGAAYIRAPNGVIERRTIDELGRTVFTGRSGGNTTWTTYTRPASGIGLEVTAQSTNGESTELLQDARGLPLTLATRAFDGAIVTRRFGYDSLRRLTLATLPSTVSAGTDVGVRYAFDEFGRLDEIDDPRTGATKITNFEGSAKVDDAAGGSRFVLNGSRGSVAASLDAGGVISFYTDVEGRPLVVEGVGGELTRFGRDNDGSVRVLSTPDGGTETLEYNGFGEVMRTVSAVGRTVEYDYNAAGQLTTRIEKGAGAGGADAVTSTEWSASGAGAGMPHVLTSESGIKTTLTFGDFGRLAGETTLVPHAITGQATDTSLAVGYGYDHVGRTASTTYPDLFGAAYTVHYKRNAHGYLREIYDTLDSGAAAMTTTTLWSGDAYDAAGRLTSESGLFGTYATHTFDAATDLLSSQSLLGSASRADDFTYLSGGVLDTVDRTFGSAHVSEKLDYDGVDRLTGASMQCAPDSTQTCKTTFGYDDFGNLASKSDVGSYAYESAAPHAATLAGGESACYYADGALKSQGDATCTGPAMWQYESFGKPSKYDVGGTGFSCGSSGGSGHSVSYFYDGTDRRAAKVGDCGLKVYGAAGVEYHGGGSGQSQVIYVPGPRGAVAAVVIDSSGRVQRHALLRDRLGSVVDDATGPGVGQRRVYDAFGKMAASTTDASLDSGFLGGEHEVETGLVNLGGRLYDPRVARFTRPDPFVTAPQRSQAWTAYGYGFNNPMRYSDPSGLATSGTVCTEMQTSEGGYRVQSCTTYTLDGGGGDGGGGGGGGRDNGTAATTSGRVGGGGSSASGKGVDANAAWQSAVQGAAGGATKWGGPDAGPMLAANTPLGAISDMVVGEPLHWDQAQAGGSLTGGLPRLSLSSYTQQLGVEIFSSSSPGYADLNVSAGYILGVTGGLISTDGRGAQYYYYGAGLTTPGISGSLTGSPGRVTPGWGVGLQLGYGLGIQVGYGPFGGGGSLYWEAGPATPGGSLMFYKIERW